MVRFKGVDAQRNKLTVYEKSCYETSVLRGVQQELWDRHMSEVWRSIPDAKRKPPPPISDTVTETLNKCGLVGLIDLVTIQDLQAMRAEPPKVDDDKVKLKELRTALHETVSAPKIKESFQ